jgi:hypothetical protein
MLDVNDMKSYILVLLLIIPTLTLAFSKEAPKDMTKFNITCPAKELCPLLDQAFEGCYTTKKEGVCSIYIQIFKKLVDNYDCQRSFDNTSTEKYSVPAYWICDALKSWAYLELLSKLELPEAQKFFASSEFRSMLDGETAEGFLDLSLERERKLKRQSK